MDNSRADTVHELYVDDGELNVPPTPLRGRQALIEWGRQLVEAPPWRSIRHACGNMRFVADGHIAAKGTTVLTVFMVTGNQAATNRLVSARTTTGSSALSGGGGWHREVGSSCSREVTS